jgi:ubiquitin-like 1-activating enzyme E1 B
LKQIKESMGSVSFAQKLFDKVFRDDIMRLRSMEDMWKSRRPPEPLEFEKLAAGALEAKERKDEILKDSQRVWTLEENLVVFHESLEMLSKRMEELQSKQEEGGPAPTIEFDKDDEDTLNFVTASANIRSLIFGIEPKSKFDTKQMAGNIIPAIATTNAIVAGLCVLQSFKVLKGEYSSTKEVCHVFSMIVRRC